MLGAAEDMCMLGGSGGLSHSNIYGVLPAEKINADMKSKVQKKLLRCRSNRGSQCGTINSKTVEPDL